MTRRQDEPRSHNVAASARALGMSESSVWTRRREWPGFRTKMEEALDEAEVVLEFRLATWGNNVGAGAAVEEGAEGTVTFPHGGASMSGEGAESDCPQPFDPEFALRFLKWREEKRRGRSTRGGREWQRPRTLDEVRDSILRKLSAIHRHREKFGNPDGGGDGADGDSPA